MKPRCSLARGFHLFKKEGGYPLPVNSVILNTSIESAYLGAKKSVKIDWKSGRVLAKKALHERTGCNAFLATLYVCRSGCVPPFWNNHRPFKNMAMCSIAIGFRFENGQKCDIRSRVDLPVTQRGVVWTRIIGGPFKPLFLTKNSPHFQSFLIDFLAPGYALLDDCAQKHTADR